MAKVLVLYHSTYGHVEAHGRGCRRRRSIHGRHAGLAQALELVPEEVARNSGYKLDQAAPIATVQERPTTMR
jgi:NAD(P)H dehydrogenase (quinone)